ncbi:MAG: ribonuclease Z [Ferruginibacter sp.]
MFALTILGNNSALPAFGRNPTAQVLQVNNDLYLIDCGEGTQLQLQRFKIKKSKIRHIFISHLHGDHYFGLIGLLTSMGLANRVEEVHLHAPQMLIKIIELQLNVANAILPFPLHFHPLGDEGKIADTPNLTVQSIKVKHRIACWGFIFREKKNLRSILPERVKAYEIPPAFFPQLQNGDDYINAKGTIIQNDELTEANTPPKSYAYCADTLYDEELVEKISGVDLLYHETTYLHASEDKAIARFHSTTKQAGLIAKKAAVKKLLIGHFSSKYELLDEFLIEASEVFKNTELALEGACYFI